MQKHIRYSNSQFHHLESMGIESATVLRRAHLSQELLSKSRFLLTTDEAFAFGEAIAEVSGNPAIGLKLGIVTGSQNFNPPGIAALCSELGRGDGADRSLQATDLPGRTGASQREG